VLNPPGRPRRLTTSRVFRAGGAPTCSGVAVCSNKWCLPILVRRAVPAPGGIEIVVADRRTANRKWYERALVGSVKTL
jgi:hypothetical protein